MLSRSGKTRSRDPTLKRRVWLRNGGRKTDANTSGANKCLLEEVLPMRQPIARGALYRDACAWRTARFDWAGCFRFSCWVCSWDATEFSKTLENICHSFAKLFGGR